MCIKDSDGKYVEIQKTGGRLFETAVEKLLPGSSANGSGEPTFLNTLHSVMRREVVPVSPNTLVPQDQPGYAIVETAGGITGKAVASDYPPVKSESRRCDALTVSRANESRVHHVERQYCDCRC